MKRIKVKIENILSKIILILKRPDMNILPGHLAFFFILALIPIMTLVTYFATLLNIPINDINTAISNLPSGIVDFIKPTLDNTTISLGNIFILIISLLVVSNGADAVILISNKLYNIKQSSYLERKVKAIIVTIIFIVLLLFMMLIPVFGNIIIDFFSSFVHKNIYKSIKVIYSILQLPISLIFIYFNIKIIYILAPDKNLKSYEVSKGAIFTTIMWVVMTQIYSYYINNFAHFGRIYGNLANLVVLMLFMYILSYIFVIGMSFNAYKIELDDEINKTGRMNIIKSIHNI